jgi:molecular chaperone GrpE|tara:strand:- start:1418 stop:2020 length:603 start_codon:yes stop_codon:yes gene_type:complete
VSEETNNDDKTAVNDDQVLPETEQKATLEEVNADIEAELLDELDKEPEQSETEQLQQQVAGANDQVLRVQAEMQNLRRRAERDVENAHKYALDKFAPELLPVVDNLERALATIDVEDPAQKSVAEGIELTLKTFVDVLVRFKVEAVDPAGQPFDAEFHQAVSMVPNPDLEPNTVMDVFQKGYTLNGRLLRPAMVVVSKPA